MGVLAVADSTAASDSDSDLDAVTLSSGVRRLPKRAYELRSHDASSLLLCSARRMSCALASGVNATDRSWSKASV